jgi:uncharacterized protein DUF3309
MKCVNMLYLSATPSSGKNFLTTSACRCREFDGMNTIILVLLILLILGSLPTWPYSANWGYAPSGGLGTILVILVVLALMGRI